MHGHFEGSLLEGTRKEREKTAQFNGHPAKKGEACSDRKAIHEGGDAERKEARVPVVGGKGGSGK